jgi:hypothetical protein
MRKIILVIFILSLRTFSHGQALRDSVPYLSGGGELILAFSNINHHSINSTPRFTGFFHLQEQINWNLNRWIGLYSGLALRNIGIIYKLNDSLSGRVKYIQRSYTLGIPFAIKLGNMNRRSFIFAGGEIEYAFAYKQKLFQNKHKDIFTDGFGNQVNQWLPSLFAGWQFHRGFCLKFKYYTGNFLNKNYTYTQNGNSMQPFAHLNTHIFYVSASILIVHKKRKRTPRKDSEKHDAIFTRL